MVSSANEAGHLLDEVNALRTRARTDRHAYRFPLVFFGALTMVVILLQGIDYELASLGGDFAHLLPPDLIDMVWLSGLVTGTGLTLRSYHRHGHRTGIQTAARKASALLLLAGGLAARRKTHP